MDGLSALRRVEQWGTRVLNPAPSLLAYHNLPRARLIAPRKFVPTFGPRDVPVVTVRRVGLGI